jgi:hypothetical protein
MILMFVVGWRAYSCLLYYVVRLELALAVIGMVARLAGLQVAVGYLSMGCRYGSRVGCIGVTPGVSIQFRSCVMPHACARQ